ncbi:MAG TPA: beta-N-acetylhexosaminidase [Xanthobacteraceae bacterium]|jgi:beta-N-acetylhexosaminidase|nr:beta-N-acetylhexosaminidase [Xanthobacteraceae bacterium]
MAKALITDAAGLVLSADERAFFRDADPWGFIIFRRNVETPDQLRALTESMRESVGRNAPILVDQEGGRVQRLGPPHWPKYPPGAHYGALYDGDQEEGLRAAWLGARLIAHDLHTVGIDVDCLPLADIPVSEADPVIGNRAYGTTPAKVAAIAAAVAEGLLAGGVLPVLKHIPGHGRATADSHHALPVVATDAKTLQSTDFAAFRPLAKLPLGMTAHVVFTAIDPVAPATTSVTMVQQVIRGHIGFDGVLMSDDISMNALSGNLAERARASLAAGCDVVLHCNGAFEERREVADACPPLAGDAKRRADAALAMRRAPAPFDLAAARDEFAAMGAVA